MTVTVQAPIKVYTAAAGATVFPYDFKIFETSDLYVAVDGTQKILGTHYTVSGAGIATGGNVTFLSAMTGGEEVVIDRDVADERDTNYQEGGDLLGQTHNDDHDRPIMLIQQLAARALQVPVGDPAGGRMVLPPVAERANMLAGYGADGRPAAYEVGSGGVTDANNVNYLPSGTGAVSKSVRKKLREQVAFTDYKDNDESDHVDNAAAIEYAMVAVKDNGDIEFPAGDSPFLIDARHYITRPCALQGNGAQLKLRGSGGANSSDLFNTAYPGGYANYVFNIRTDGFRCLNLNFDGNSRGNYKDYTITPASTLTLSAVSGAGVTATLTVPSASPDLFNVSDVGATIAQVAGAGRATITAVSATGVTATVTITANFSGVGPHVSGSWSLGPRRYYQKSDVGDVHYVGLFMVGWYQAAAPDHIEDIRFNGCHFVDAPTQPIDFFMQGHSFADGSSWKWIKGLRIEDNFFDRSNGVHLPISHTLGAVITGNTHKNPYFAFFQWYYHNTGALYADNNIVFNSSEIDFSLVDPLNKTGTALNFGYAKLGKIDTEPNTNCHFDDNVIRGGHVYFTAGNRLCTVHDNKIDVSETVGITVQPGTPLDVGNSIKRNKITQAAEPGLYLSDIQASVQVHDNEVVDCCRNAAASAYGGRRLNTQIMVFSDLYDLKGNTVDRISSGVDYGVIYSSRAVFNGTKARGNIITSGGDVADAVIATIASAPGAPTIIETIQDPNNIGILERRITISSAEVLALHATPKVLVAAPGAGKAVIFESAQFFLDYNAAAYAGIAGGEDIEIRYTDGAGQLVGTVETTGFLDQTADNYRHVYPVTTAAITQVDNAALILTIASGEVTTGDSPLYVKLRYRLVDTAF